MEDIRQHLYKVIPIRSDVPDTSNVIDELDELNTAVLLSDYRLVVVQTLSCTLWYNCMTYIDC